MRERKRDTSILYYVAPVCVLVLVISVYFMVSTVRGALKVRKEKEQKSKLEAARRAAERELDIEKSEEKLVPVAQAKSAYEAAAKYAAEHPEDFDGIIERYQQVAKIEGGQRWATEARTEVVRMKSARIREGRETYADLKKKADKLVEEQKFAEAVKTLQSFPDKYAEVEEAKRIPDDIKRIRALAQDAYKAIESEAETLRQQGRLEEARALYVKVENEFGAENVVEAARQNAKELLREIAERDLASVCEEVDEHAATFSFGRAIERLRSFQAADDFPDLAAKLHWRIKAISRVRDFFDSLTSAPVNKALSLTVRQRNGVSATGTLESLNLEEIVLRLSSGSTLAVKWRDADPRAMNDVGKKFFPDKADEAALCAGIMSMFLGDLPGAQTSYRLAEKLGARKADVEFYMAKLAEFEAEKGEEFLAAVRQAMAEGKWSAAIETIAEARKFLRGTEFLKNNADKFDALEQKCKDIGSSAEEALPTEETKEPAQPQKLKKITDRKVKDAPSKGKPKEEPARH